MSCLLIICSLTFTPPSSSKSRPSSLASSDESQLLLSNPSWIEKIIYVKNWHNPRFVIWALVLPCSLFGYFVPFIHLVQFAKSMPLDQDPTSNTNKASFLLACISITSGIFLMLRYKVVLSLVKISFQITVFFVLKLTLIIHCEKR